MQDVSFGDLTHPALTLEAKPSLERLWSATGRVLKDVSLEPRGSGFLINGGPDGVVVVTNAHVVHPTTDFVVEHVRNRFYTRLIAVDYPHDLAILQPVRAPEGPLAVLDFAPSPLPGEEVWVCGYPFGVDTPRISRALVSGHGTYTNSLAADRHMQAVILDANINPGNSGGPVCDKELRVVGVCVATQLQKPIPILEGLNKRQSEALTWISERLRVPGTGTGYAIDPVDVNRLRATRAAVPPKRRSPISKHPPRAFPMSLSDFVSLQNASLTIHDRPHNSSPIGPFSFDQSGRLFLGWHGSQQVEIPTNAAWVSLLLQVSQTGGSFLLRGYDVVLWRRKYKGCIIGATIRIEES
ncbi:MAG: S1 family peptidase [bacterium]